MFFAIAGVKLGNGLCITRSEHIFAFRKCTKHLYLIDIKGIFYSEMCINMFTVLAFGIFLH